MTAYSQLRNRLAGRVGELAPVRHAVNWLLGPGATIFTFHRVLPRGAECFEPEMCTSEDAFADFLDWIEENYQVVPLDEVASRNGDSSNRKRPDCAITFDDGWYDNYAYAFPHLQRRGLTATIFLPTRFIGTDRRFWQEHLWLCLRELKDEERRREVLKKIVSGTPWFPPGERDCNDYHFLRRVLLTRPSTEAEEFTQRIMEYAGFTNSFAGRAFLNWQEVRQMGAAGISFGSHTLDHTLLANAPPKVGGREIRDSRAELESMTNEHVKGFAYPWGAVGPSSIDQLRESGYEFAVTTKPGLVTSSSNPHLLPRLGVSDSVLASGTINLDRGKVRLYLMKQVLGARSGRRSLRKVSTKGNKRIKIFFVLDLITEWEGGTERQLRLLIQSLDPKYFEPKLCFLFGAPDLPQESLPCPLYVLTPNSGPVSALRRLSNLIRVLRQERPDIVQCFFVEGLVTGILAGRLAQVPQVVGSVRNAGYWRKLGHRLVIKAITPLADHWQTNSRALWTFQNKVEAVHGTRIEILPNGTDVARFMPATPEERRLVRCELGLNSNGPICVSVANLYKVKGLDTLIHAAALLRAEFPSIQFVLVGDGPQREELQDLATRLGLSEVIRFVGRQVDVRPYLVAADVGVLTSHSEGSSNSVLEYMSMNLPSIVSDIPANREVTEALLFTPGDATDLGAKLSLLLRDANLCSQLRAQYKETIEQFSMERFALRAESFYYKLVAESRSA
jgi:glycosyltransferase involved in cell wall biosynthesis/peptidoglycan/xylan/chitin deacetylase (PgdA/CDA1 family)